MGEEIEMRASRPYDHKSEVSNKIGELHKISDIELEKFSDDRGYKILTIAAENGWLDAVKYLIRRGDDVNRVINDETAASVAFANGHFEVVLALLQGNAKIPKNYDHDVASEELKSFVEMSVKMHEKMSDSDQENLVQNIKKFPTVRYFYDLANNSLLKSSIINKMFAVYELLLSMNIFLAPHEDMNELLDELTSKEQKNIRDINLKLSSDLITEEMMILMRNCKLGPDTKEEDHASFMKIIREAFDFLFKIPTVSLILRIVAASRDFKIVFDFNRESVTFLDPSAEPYTNGLFYYSGKIYIAAKELLDPRTTLENYGVMIHELAHYAFFLIYNNEANPYFVKSLKVKNIFTKVAAECNAQKDSDDIVGSVFDEYPEEMHHAELIVRAPQMLVIYSDEKMYEKFRTLIDFYKNYCIPRFERDLPKIEAKFNPFKKIEKKVKVQRFWIIFLFVSVIICTIGAFAIWNPTISWESLEESEKMIVKNSTVKFHDIDVKFGEIFSSDSNVFGLISSEVLKRTIEGDTKDLSKAIKEVYDQFVYLKWENMTKGLRRKFLTLDARFQGQLVPWGLIMSQTIKKVDDHDFSLNEAFGNQSAFNYSLIDDEKALLKAQIDEKAPSLLNLSSLIFIPLNSLTPLEIRNTFNKIPFNISSITETKVDFFIRRYFVDSYIYIDENFYSNDTSIDVTHKSLKTIENVIESVQSSRIFLLSSVAGEGKSTSFRYLSIKMKETFKSKWVQFVDLKRYYEAYKKGKKLNFGEFEVLSKFLKEKLLDLNFLEGEIFLNHFESGNVVFLWDGIDEVAPLYKEVMLSLTGNIMELTQNIQFISTRPHHVKVFEVKFSTNAHKLVPLGKLERSEMLVKFIGNYLKLDAEKLWENSKELFVTSNFEKDLKNNFGNVDRNETESDSMESSAEASKSSKSQLRAFKENLSTIFINELKLDSNITLKIFQAIKKCEKIFHSIEASDFRNKQVTNPLLVQIISSVSTDEDFEVKSTLNLFQVYEIFVTKKFRIIHQKGEVVLKDFDKVAISRTINVNLIHQAYAVKLLFGDFIEQKLSSKGLNISDLNVMKTISTLTDEEISRFGIVHVLHTEFNFVHRTFGEFFAAQFLYDSMLEGGLDANTKDGQIKLFIITYINFFNFETVVKKFMFEAMSNEKILSPTMKTLYEDRLKKARNYDRGLDHGIFYLFKFMSYIKFFDAHYKISLLNFFVDDPIRFSNIHIIDDLVREWEIFEEIYSAEDFHFAVTGPLLGDEGKMLQQTCIHEADEVFVDFIGKLEKTLNRTEISKDLKENPKIFICVARKKNEKTLKAFWDYVERNSEKAQQKKLLKAENQNFQTALDASMLNGKDKNVFDVVSGIYGKFFVSSEIQEILLNFNQENLPIFYDFAKSLNFDDNSKLIKFYEKTFESLKLRKILSHRDIFGNSIFSFSEFRNENYEKNLKVYVESLKKTFDNNENFEKFYEGLKFRSKLAKTLSDGKFHENVEIKTFEVGDFYHLIENWDKVTKNFLKNSSILFDLGYIDGKNEKLIPKFLAKLNETLNRNEIKNLMTEKENFFFKNSMQISKNSSIETIKIFWEFIESFLSFNELKEFLTLEDSYKWKFLQYSALDSDKNSFLYVSKIYEKFLTPETIEKVLTTPDAKNLTFIFSIMDIEGNLETVQELTKYLKELFKNEKLNLRKFLSHRTDKNYSFFSYFKNFHHNQIPQKLESFKELLEKTFETKNEFVKYLRKLALRKLIN